MNPDRTTSETETLRFGARLRDSLALTRSRAVDGRDRTRSLPLVRTIEAVFARAVERVRTTLDLPSRREMAALTKRLDALDRRLAEFEHKRTEKGRGSESKSSE